MINEDYRIFEESSNQQELTRHAQICELAYQKWQEAGEPHGDGVNFWIDAEQQWETNRLLEERWSPPSDDEWCPPIRPDRYDSCNHEVEDEIETTKKPTFLERLKSWL